MRAPDSSVRKVRCLYTRIVPGVTGSERREGTNGTRGGIGVGGGNVDGGGNGDWNGVGSGNVDVNGDGDEAGTRTEVEVNE